MIEVSGLHHIFPDGTEALNGIDLEIAEGECCLVCGANGSGKTTLVRHLNGLLSPTSGSVRVDGLDTVHDGKEVRVRVGMVFQDADSQIVGEIVREDVAFGPENLGLEPMEVERRVETALRSVGLENHADRACHRLSGGEKRLLAVAGVLAMEPRAIVFDEPFANLDLAGVRRVLDQILRLKETGCTLVITTHDVEKVLAHADRAAILASGRIAASGTPSELVNQFAPFGIRPPCSILYGQGIRPWIDL